MTGVGAPYLAPFRHLELGRRAPSSAAREVTRRRRWPGAAPGLQLPRPVAPESDPGASSAATFPEGSSALSPRTTESYSFFVSDCQVLDGGLEHRVRHGLGELHVRPTLPAVPAGDLAIEESARKLLRLTAVVFLVIRRSRSSTGRASSPELRSRISAFESGRS